MWAARRALAGTDGLAIEPVELGHVRRGGRGRIVEEITQHPGAALDGTGALAVAAHREDRGHP